MLTRVQDWVTNNPELAAMLTKADKEFVRAREAAKDLPLAEKVSAYCEASKNYDAAYKAIIARIKP